MKIAILTLNPGIDRIIYLDTPTRLGTLNRAAKSVVNQGSKGANVAIMLKTLGADPHYFTFTGGDMARLSESFTDSALVNSSFIQTACGVRTNTKIIDIDGVCTEFNERGGPVTNDELERIINSIKSYKPELVVMNGSLPQGVTFPNSTSQTALPLSIPPSQAIRSAESFLLYFSVQPMSIILPVFRITTVFSKASVAASSMAVSASVR